MHHMFTNIEKYDSMPKTDDGGLDKKRKDIAKCFKMVQAIMVVTMFTFDQANFSAIFMQKSEETKSSKKKKAAKTDEVSVLIKFAENLNLKCFEEKHEKTPD